MLSQMVRKTRPPCQKDVSIEYPRGAVVFGYKPNHLTKPPRTKRKLEDGPEAGRDRIKLPRPSDSGYASFGSEERSISGSMAPRQEESATSSTGHAGSEQKKHVFLAARAETASGRDMDSQPTTWSTMDSWNAFQAS